MGLFRGLWAPFRGASFIAKHGLWAYVVAPILANALVAGLAGVASYWVVGRWAPGTTSTWWHLGKAALAFLLTIPVFLVLYPLVSAPFIDVLTEKAEAIVAGGHPSSGFWVGATQAVVHGAAKSLLYLFALSLTGLLSVVAGPAAFLGVALGALFLAYDGFDFPLARRRVGFWGKWSYLWGHPGQTIGYSTAAALVFTLPLAFVVVPPFAAVGATLVYLDKRS